MKRMSDMDLEIFCDTINTLKKYNVNIFTKGIFNFEKFKSDCKNAVELLSKNDEPINGIRYELCDLLSAVQTIVGLRNIGEFMSE
jgi:hypothetical protein